MKVTWTHIAKIQAHDILSYGKLVFGKVVAAKMARKLEKNNTLLASNPLLGPIEPALEKHNLGYRYIMINSVYKEIYYIDNDTIYIVAIWDCRQYPIYLQDMISE